MDFLIFSTAQKEYGLDIKNIIQVIRMKEITPVPGAADFVEGVITWHKKVIPLINLRKKLNLPQEASQKINRIIITKSNNNNIGVIVDNVVDVLKFDQANIEPVDEMLKKAEYLAGVIKVGQKVILLMNMEKLLSSEDSASIQAVHSRVEVKNKGI